MTEVLSLLYAAGVMAEVLSLLYAAAGVMAEVE
jgi:hypothetical protein